MYREVRPRFGPGRRPWLVDLGRTGWPGPSPLRYPAGPTGVPSGWPDVVAVLRQDLVEEPRERMDTQLASGEQIAGYRIESFLARGGMAVVYRARHIRLDRRVALKLLAPELSENESFRRRFMRESELAASIDHPNIIPVFEASKIGDVLYIAMRYVDGPDLGELLEREGPLSLDRAIGLFQQAASALDEAHERGLVHRDVKPGNMLIAPGARADGTDHVYLTDFGLTKRSDSLTGLTGTGQFIGTIDYIAPEQINGQPVDGRADVYALGCVLFRALTGVAPFERDSDVAVMYAHLSSSPPTVTSLRPDLPNGVDGVLTKSMAKRPDDRYQSCCDLIADLRAVAQDTNLATFESDSDTGPGAPTARSPLDAPSLDRPVTGRRVRRLVAAVAVLSVLLAGGALAAWRLGPGAARGPTSVVLPFAAETYPSGLSVSRTWTLSGRNGDHLHGELQLSTTKDSANATFYELLPNKVFPSLSKVTFMPTKPSMPAGSAVLYQLPVAKARKLMLAYDAPVVQGPVTLKRLQDWAAAWRLDAGQFYARHSLEQPRLVDSLQLQPGLELKRGDEALLSLSGYDSNSKQVDEEVLGRALYFVDKPRLAAVDHGGADGSKLAATSITARSAGTVTVTVVLGSAMTSTEVRIA